MDRMQVRKQAIAMTVFALLATSTFTAFGVLPLFVQEAEAQAALRIETSVSANPAFQNHFFGAQIVQAVINDPGATDPDESTVSLVVNGFITPRAHLADGRWYSFFAEDQAFSILLDVVSDGLRDNDIDVQDNDGVTSPLTIGGFTYTVTAGAAAGGSDSPIRQITVAAGFTWIEVDQFDWFPTLPLPFFEDDDINNISNPDLHIPTTAGDGAGDLLCEIAPDGDGGGNAVDAEFNVQFEADGTTPEPTEALSGIDTDCDWPYIKLIGLEELSIASVQAGPQSVSLIFDDLPSSITAALDRTTNYPLEAEVKNAFTDFMWNINPVEEDSVFFALDRVSGANTRILYQPVATFDPASDGLVRFIDITTVFTTSPGMEFDERQVLELDSQGVAATEFALFLDQSTVGTANPIIGQFGVSPFEPTAATANRVDQFTGINAFVLGTDGDVAAERIVVAATDEPVIGMFEGDPNVSIFDNTLEGSGGRATLFAGVRDRIVSFDYFDIIRSARFLTHDGFTSVNAEVYNSADRAVFTVTDHDLNLRSNISEEPTGRQSFTFLNVGSPFILMNTQNTAATISNTNIDRISNVYAATFLVAGDGAIRSADTFGVTAAGVSVFADIGTTLGEATATPDGIISMGTGAAEGTEAFTADGTAAGGPDIAVVTTLDAANRRAAVVFTPGQIGGSNPSGIVIDTTLTINDIDDFVDIQDITGNELLGQVRIDNLFDGDAIATQNENFLIQASEIREQDGDILSVSAGPGNAAIVGATSYDVRLPRYNLLNVDLTDLSLSLTYGRAVVAIQVIDSTCAGSAVIATAFATTCVHAAQVVDFQLVETAAEANEAVVNRDVDAILTTGDTYNDAVLDAAAPEGAGLNLGGPFTAAQVDAWSADAAAGLDGTNTETGFDRDPLTRRTGLGVFRPLDLSRVADANDGDGANSHLTDRIRIVIIMISQADAGSIAAGFVQNEPVESIRAVEQTVVVDIGGMGITFQPGPTDAAPNQGEASAPGTFSNLAYRLELDEEGENSNVFTGRADFFTFIQHDTVSDVISEIVLTGDPLKMWMPNRFIPPNRLAFSYVDNDVVQFFREVSASFIYETADGTLSWDRNSYSFGQDAFLTIADEDLNRRPDAQERYPIPLNGFIFMELNKQTLDVESSVGGGACGPAVPANGDTDGNGVNDCILSFIDTTLAETSADSGEFVSQITMPAELKVTTDQDTGAGVDFTASTNTRDIEANYIDIRDRSSVRQEFDGIVNIRTSGGDVVLDRAAYPPGAILYVEIHDNDFNTDVDIRENIDLTQVVRGDTLRVALTDTTDDLDNISAISAEDLRGTVTVAGVAQPLRATVEILVLDGAGARLFTILPAALVDANEASQLNGLAANAGRFGTGIITNAVATAINVLPMLDRNNQPVTTARETGPNSGIFEFEVRLPGPAFDSDEFPIRLPTVLAAGTVANPTIQANRPIEVDYADNSDEKGEVDVEEELGTYLFNTARLRTDKTEYGLGDSVDFILEEPDFNLDSRAVDTIAYTVLDVITDKIDTEVSTNDNFACLVRQGPADLLANCQAAQIRALRMNLTVLRESSFNTGVFAAQLEELVNTFVDRGEEVQLIYNDQTPSGGGASIRIEHQFLVAAILPEIVFDKEEYTPFDEFIVTVVSPDSNQDPDRIESISVKISSSSGRLGTGRTNLPETAPNSGIFQEDFDLNPAAAVGETLRLKAIREDGLTVEFRIDEDTVATKSVFVNFHVGQVMFDKDAFGISERGVLRVIDPDGNLNPDTIDTTSVRFWSTTDRGGLLVVLRETGDRTGIFEELISFTPDEESTGTRLRVSEGDTITAKYTDQTLPAPAALEAGASPVRTVEVEELFASATIGAIVPQLERAVASEPELVDQSGAAVEEASIGSIVLVQSDVTNSQNKAQKFAYIVKVQDSDGVVVFLSWVTGELPAKESLTAAQSYLPDKPGEYTAEIFVWDGVATANPLSPSRSLTFTVA